MEDVNRLQELEQDLFLWNILAYETVLIRNLETSLNIIFRSFNEAFVIEGPIIEEELEMITYDMQQDLYEKFSLTENLEEIFSSFEYALNEKNKKIYFETDNILIIFAEYLKVLNSELKFDEKDPLFDLILYLYFSDSDERTNESIQILSNFCQELYGYIIYRDFINIMRFINSDFVVSSNDNHIPIRIAMLNSLNLINELNNTVPNKENIYRIVHAIVGGNEDNVKKYCLSLIGQNSTSQKQITKKHLDFAQRYINEKKL
ncbi:hypothetical protein [Chryseobacterium lathyri]|uniref:Uncharacterized protein n=1 Tax=Chryseobacterium lathyri TaxID=395933 RepID=A0A511YGA6_9FLAO|nr:hypothetical protein [Chryseobacterium lathyri]GEN74211.1 hypothetical protein CLA01_42830 [Chryseobacterium lathyri]